jgi:DNA-binding cell septation regulator SpoVG
MTKQQSVFSNMKLWANQNQTGSLLGSGSVVVNGIVEVKFRVLMGTKGVFASLPAQKSNKKNEQGKDIWFQDVRFLTEELYTEFQNLVKSEWKKVGTIGKSNSQVNKNSQNAGEEDQTGDNLPF